MYKSGKRWLIAAVVAGGVGVFANTSVNADTVNANSNATQTEQVSKNENADNGTVEKQQDTVGEKNDNSIEKTVQAKAVDDNQDETTTNDDASSGSDVKNDDNKERISDDVDSEDDYDSNDDVDSEDDYDSNDDVDSEDDYDSSDDVDSDDDYDIDDDADSEDDYDSNDDVDSDDDYDTNDDYDSEADAPSISVDAVNNGKHYTINAHAPEESWNGVGPLFDNVVVNPDGSDHTYSFYGGDSSTSAYYIRKSNGDYAVINGSDVSTTVVNNDLKQVFVDSSTGLEVTEIVHITQDGQIQHTVTIKNVGDQTLNNVSFGTMLDTMLDDNDDISLYASGNGVVFIKNDELTLYVEALRNAHVYAGQWNGSESDIADRLKVSGNYGKSLINDVDSAVQYETDFLNLAKGQSYIYSYVERLFTAHESLGQVTVHYVDENGNKIHDDKVLGNIVGEGFDEQPISIDGYVFSRTLGNAKGVFSKDPQNITFVYTHKEVTPAENNPETPSQDKPENPSAPSTDENKPAEPSVSAPDVQTPEAPRNNNVIPTNVNHVTSVTPTQVTNKPQLTENNVKQTNSVTLPQTNENPRSASLLTTIGLVISGMIATLGLTIKRRHD